MIQLTLLSEMIEAQWRTCRIKLAENRILSIESCFADKSLIIVKRDAATVKIHLTAMDYCRGSGTLLHAEKSVAIFITSHNQEQFSYGLEIVKEDKDTIILRFPMGTNIARDRIVQGVISRSMKNGRSGKTEPEPSWDAKRLHHQLSLLRCGTYQAYCQ